ncbi:MAG: 3TM-type holin [bacterium]
MSALLSLVAQVGAPFIQKALSEKLGGPLATDVLRGIADRAGVSPAALDDAARDQPELIRQAIAETEARAPEIIALQEAELDAKLAIFESERTEPVWVRAWRPLGMYGLGLLWFWNVIFLHVANAYWKIALPPMPFEHLMGISALYMTLYMGGHTIKDVAGKWVGK